MYFKHLKTNNTFYKNIYEYHGVVETVDKVNKKFTAILINSNDSEDVLSAEFRLDDINYESDKKLIDVGVNIIWIIGQEQQVMHRRNQLTAFLAPFPGYLTVKPRDKWLVTLLPQKGFYLQFFLVKSL